MKQNFNYFMFKAKIKWGYLQYSFLSRSYLFISTIPSLIVLNNFLVMFTKKN